MTINKPSNDFIDILIWIFIALFACILLSSCQKEKKESPQANATSHDVKYEVIGTCCYMQVKYLKDGITNTHTSNSQFNWSYQFDAPTGTTLQLTGISEVGGNQEWTVINIYIDGTLSKTSKGYGLQSINQLVP